MMAAVGAVGVAFSFGPALPGYGWLHLHVPLFTGIRAAARWGILLLTAVAVLAGFAVAAAERRWRRATYWPAALVVLLSVLTLEALRAPLAFTRVPAVPDVYDRLRDEPRAVVVELPLFGGVSVSENARYLFTATRHFKPLVNGYSGFEPEAARHRAERWRAFPAPAVVDEMRQLGVTHVMLHLDGLAPAQVSEAAASPAFELLAEAADLRLYRLRR
jgi:hypothetical protein